MVYRGRVISKETQVKRARFISGLFTGHDPTRKMSQAGLCRVIMFYNLTGGVGLGWVGSDRVK